MTKQRSTKRALLMSALSLLLCFSMLIGSTFAWFTDSVTSGKNKIVAGNLDVELEYAKVVNGALQPWASVADQTDIFNPNALWEPGHVEVVYLRVSNLGSLELKYQLGVNIASETSSISVETNEEFKLSDFLVFKTVEMPNALTTYSDREAAQLAAGTELGLKDYNGKTTKLEVGGTDYVALIVYMPETVGNEANYKKDAPVPTIELGINLFATQVEAEDDSFGDDYDENAWHPDMVVTSASELAIAIENVKDGGIIALADNLTFDENSRTPNGGNWYEGLYYVGDKSFTIDLNGKTITNDSSVNDYLMLFKNDGTKANTITIKNGTIEASSSAYCAICTAGNSTQQITINLENVKVTGNNSNGSVLKIRGGAELNVKAGTVITGNDSYLAIENGNATVNIYDGAEIYQNGTTSYNGCLVGVGANGTVNVYGGYGKGVAGGFIAMTSGGTINVYGGEWIADTDGTFSGNDYVLIAQSDKATYGGDNSIVNVTGGDFKGGFNCYGNAVGDAQLNISAGTFDADPSAYVASGFEAIENNGVYYVVPDEVSNVVVNAAQLQAALDAATGDTLIVFAADINGDVLAAQKAGVNVVIDGKNYAYDGTIKVDGNGRSSGTETLIIKNINFVTEVSRDFITADVSWIPDNGTAYNYAHNVTIEDCTFTNNGTGTVVPARFRQSSNITMRDCTVVDTFSPIWTRAVDGLTISNVTANCTNEGIHVGTSDDVLIENCTITVPGAEGFGIRADATGAYTMTVNNCTLNAAKAIYLRNAVDAYTLIVDGGKYASTTQELITAIKNAPVGQTTTIFMPNGTYTDDIDLTVAALGAAGGDVVIKAMEGANPVIAGTVTIGYRQQNVGAATYGAKVTFDGITFDHAEAGKHCLNVQDVESFYMVNCTVIGDGEYGLSTPGSNGTGYAKIEKCKFINAGLQLAGKFAQTLVIDYCEFEESVINVQGGGPLGPTIQNSKFDITLKAAHSGESFYVIRNSNAGANINVKNCEISVDAEQGFTGVAGAKGWGVFVNRIASYDINAEYVEITMTDAALAQSELKVATCLSTGKINMTNVTLNGIAQ